MLPRQLTLLGLLLRELRVTELERVDVGLSGLCNSARNSPEVTMMSVPTNSTQGIRIVTKSFNCYGCC